MAGGGRHGAPPQTGTWRLPALSFIFHGPEVRVRVGRATAKCFAHSRLTTRSRNEGARAADGRPLPPADTAGAVRAAPTRELVLTTEPPGRSGRGLPQTEMLGLSFPFQAQPVGSHSPSTG